MSISFQSEEIVLNKLRERLRRMTDEELIKFGRKYVSLPKIPFRSNWKKRERNGREGGNQNDTFHLAVRRAEGVISGDHLAPVVRTSFTLCHADQSAQQRNSNCSCGLEPARSQAPHYVETHVDLGPWTGDGQTPGHYGSYRCAGVLL